ncbi:TetR/AcrR family transcriptional regulator [Herbiconiux sp. L3-i23]|uniref:TetR/AcrR family transcriptional regulator n=1 Tax=Herbiconiux sp. L3-i23 TaxID=2905871 RepID=UPI00206F5439|nr:TetR/AcrR family transcriptional regulator [Herbiconiux sp. L3-i23]BDI22622.1 transcriptional regulator [Herbiconiux sp. L3-i23]
MAQRGPYAKSAVTREHVLDAVLRVIAETGYAGATLQQVADAVGMSKAGILHHFDSRDALLVAVLARRDDLNRLRVDEGAIPLDGDGSATVLAELTAVMRHNETVPGLVALYTALAGAAAADAGERESRRYFAGRFSALRTAFAGSVRAAQREGAIRSDLDAETVATLLIAAADGLQVQWLLEPSIDMGEHLDALASLLRP